MRNNKRSEGGTIVKSKVTSSGPGVSSAAGRTVRSAAAAAMAWLLAAALVLTGSPAFAAQDAAETPSASLAISGVDFMQPQAGAWEVLRIDGLEEGDSLYLDMERNDADGATPLIGRMEYRSVEAGEGAGERIAQIVSLNLKGEAPAEAWDDAAQHATYTLRVYAERRGGEPLYEGTVYPVYAELRDGSEVVGRELIGIRTASEDERAVHKSFGVGATFYQGGVGDDGTVHTDAYRLQNAGGAADGHFDESLQAFVVRYQKVADTAVSGSVRYVTLDGEVVRTDTVSIEGTEPVTVAIESSFVEKGRYFRAVSNLSGSRVALSAASAHAVVRVAEVAGMAETDYSVTVRYLDEDGALLWSDAVEVKGYGYQYTLPTSFSMVETDGVNFYTLDGVEGAEAAGASRERAAVRAWEAPTIKFDASVDPDADLLRDGTGNYYLNARYLSSDVTRRATLSLVAVDGSTGRPLPEAAQPGTFEVTPEAPARFTPKSQVIDGVTYVPWSGDGDIVYTWDDLAAGTDLRQYVYYVPEGYTTSDDPARSAYDIAVQYVNVANGAVIRTETATIDPEAAGTLVIAGAERFTEGGNEYVRLPGQEAGIRHAYFAPTRTYAVYYRDVNDVLSAETTIRRTQIIETERVVEVFEEPGRTMDASFVTVLSAAPTTIAADGATTVDMGVSAGDGIAIINDDANPLASLGGVGTAVDRVLIEDDGTPLSAGLTFASELRGVAAGAGALALIAAATAFGLWLRRKRGGKTVAEPAVSDQRDE